MKHLEELGLDTNDASMCYKLYGRGDIDGELIDLLPWVGGKFPKNGNFSPAYTLQDILEKLPGVIDDMYTLILDMGRNCISYQVNDDLYGVRFFGENALDAAHQMLIWCINKGCIETKLLKIKIGT